MPAGIFTSGTTPDMAGSIILTFACVLLACFAAGLRQLLRAGDSRALPSIVLAAGAASSALFAVGYALINAQAPRRRRPRATRSTATKHFCWSRSATTRSPAR